MDQLAVDLVLLRSAAPDLPIVVGRVLFGRVLERHGRQGILNLAGAILTAELPDEAQPGDRLRLVVRETTAERVVLQLVAPPPPALAEMPRVATQTLLPGGGYVEALARDGGGEGPGADVHELTLRCELPRLGTVDVWLALAPEQLRARVALVDGDPLALAREEAGALRAALAAAVERPVEVTIVGRADPLDVYV
jgi:hypothetical protein